MPVHQQQQPEMGAAVVSQEELGSLRQQLQANEAELSSLRSNLADKAEECSRLEAELGQLKADSDHLRQLLSAKEAECSGLQSSLSHVKADQDLASSTYTETVDNLRRQHREEIETLRSEATRTSQDKEAVEAELQISEQECLDLKENLAKVSHTVMSQLVKTYIPFLN